MTENLTFGTASAPAAKAGRTAAPNPFDGHFPTPVNDDGPQALTLTLKGDEKANADTIKRLTGQARRAASALDTPMSARVQVQTQGTGKNTETVVFIWTVSKIERKRNETPAATA